MWRSQENINQHFYISLGLSWWKACNLSLVRAQFYVTAQVDQNLTYCNLKNILCQTFYNEYKTSIVGVTQKKKN